MNNKLEIHSDKINIYIEITVRTKLAGKISIVAILIFLTIICIFTIWKTNPSSDSIFGISIAFILLFILPIKYLLWNFFGKEHLIINTKSISYSFDYGLIKTNLNTHKIDKLALKYNERLIDNKDTFGQLAFYNYKQENNLPELIYKTNTLLKKQEIEVIEAEIKKLYFSELYKDYGFIDFSEN